MNDPVKNTRQSLRNIYHFCGRDLDEMSREELLQVVKLYMGMEIRRQQAQYIAEKAEIKRWKDEAHYAGW